jgi:hypothetical protein
MKLFGHEHASKTNTSWLELILHAFGVGTSHRLTRTHMTHHGPGSGDATTILSIVYSVTLRGTRIRMSHFPETPEMESRNCPECVPVGLPGLWTAITPRPDLGSGRGLNQSCSPLWDLSKNISHSPSARREQVDSRLLVVGSQTVSLTPGPSFAHNLSYRCPNDQCEAILNIYASRPFQRHQEHLNARCFGPCCWTLKIRESPRTPSPQLWECEFHPHTWPKWGCDNLGMVFQRNRDIKSIKSSQTKHLIRTLKRFNMNIWLQANVYSFRNWV